MATEPQWVTVVLKLGSTQADRAKRFWQDVTNYMASETTGARNGRSDLQPAEGDCYLAVEEIGPPGVLLELRVADPESAVEGAAAAGARIGPGTGSNSATLRSPGGLEFRFVTGEGRRRPPPAVWPSGHRSQLDQVCLDVPPQRHHVEVGFWQTITGWDLTPSSVSGFTRLEAPAVLPLRWLIQKLDDGHGDVSAHVDLACDDRDAELARHRALGASEGCRHDWWTVLTDPVGRRYCVTRRGPWAGPS